MARKKVFDDGSVVEWVDKETLRYTNGSFSVLVWVDFEPGFFSTGRIIKASSIKKWDTFPNGDIETVNDMQKRDIIERIQKYYESRNRRSRVEEG